MNQKEFLQKLEIELKVSKFSDYTVRNYCSVNAELLRLTDKLPQEITSDDVKLFFVNQISEKSSATITLYLAAIKFAYLTILGKDITNEIKRPRKEKKIPVVLSKNEIKEIINNISNHKSKLMVSLMYACGFRVSELISLTVDNLDFGNSIGYVKQSKGKKDRMFNIPKYLEDELLDHVANQRKEKQEFLFSGPKGKLSQRKFILMFQLKS
jgi:integrase/recombinase XerD